jgi:GNAT superfamily N-acetyltransferase
MEEFEIRPLRPPPWTALEPLIAESEREGFRFLARLRREHEAGEQRFDGPGEVLLGVFAGGALAAVGGVTADPYEPGPRAGRIRHVYVARTRRRHGVGRMLVDALIAAARPHFDALTLRTDTAEAARFYEALGFAPVTGSPHHTHRLCLSSHG